MDEELYQKIIQKKEFSKLPRRDVELAYSQFERRETIDEEKIKLTRALLHRVFGAFLSEKLLNKKIIDKKSIEKILKRHISTRERFNFYSELYERILKDFTDKKINVIDLGAGINGLSYKYFDSNSVNYISVESIGQLVELMNYYFRCEKIKNAKAFHLSLFELEKVKELTKKQKGRKIVFLFKVVDSLEMLERDYSKKLLKKIVPLVDRVVVSFATRSLISKKSFSVKRYWFENFIKDNFNVLDTFELGGEKYFVFRKKE